jgi:hypothetical protein
LFRFRGPRYPPHFVSRGLRSRSQKVRGCLRGRVVVQPATQVPVCSHVDVSGISQVPRRSVPCLCLVPGPRPNRRCLASLRSRRCCPRSLHSEDFSVMEISGLPRGFSTCCLHFTSGVATTHARLASGWRARLYRKGVEPSGSLQKVSDHSSSSSGFILAQEGPSFISRTVTHRRLDRRYSCHTTHRRHAANRVLRQRWFIPWAPHAAPTFPKVAPARASA